MKNRGAGCRHVPRLTALICCLLIDFAAAQTAADGGTRQVGLFHRPALHAELMALEQLIRDGQHERAERVIRQRLGRLGNIADYHFLLAAALAAQGRSKSAMDSLEEAARLGFAVAGRQMSRHFAGIADRPRFRQLADRISSVAPAGRQPERSITPGRISGRNAWVGPENTLWDPDDNVLRTYFLIDDAVPAGPVQVATDEAAARLNRLFLDGRAAGNAGDLYDNRDNDHSTLEREAVPQLTFVEYGDEVRRARVNTGANPGFLFNAVTFGNSSMAVTGGPFWRSQPRLVLTRPGGAQQLYREYSGNHLYIYPEHRDHDPGLGDLVPANTPYVLISQGSSGSDRPLLRAVASILAAFRPDVKAFLRRNSLIMPTVQMIIRSSRAAKLEDGGYLSGSAHPSVFAADQLDLVSLIDQANSLTVGTVPPMVRLKVVEETDVRPAIDVFGGGDERLFDTPSAIARIARSTVFRRTMRLSVAETVDPNGRRLIFQWVVLRGDAERIRITPQSRDGSIVELSVPWHERKPVPGRPDLVSNRVDIGVFAHNGAHYSAPAFVSFLFPANQWREYDGAGRIRFVDYHTSRLKNRYTDPLLFPLRDWSDRYDYDGEGRLLGWTRKRAGGEARYTRHGARVIEVDGLGRPLRAAVVRYRVEAGAGGIRRVVEVPTGKVLRYAYGGNEDRHGVVFDVDGDATKPN